MTAPSAAEQAGPLVIVVDDDANIRDALQALFRSVGLRSEAYGSTTALLARAPPEQESCLVLDVRLPGLSGLDLQAQLQETDRELPIIFMTGHGDIPMTVRAMKAGAVDFLAKPFRDQDMLDAVSTALEHDRRRRRERQEAAQAQALYRNLTPRERQVMAHVVSGLMNKQIAGEIGLSEITVKIHRSNLMRKIGARTVADLVRIAEVIRSHPLRDDV